jgi:hypothetical protein
LQISMSHADLVIALGDKWKLIEDAGFEIVPKKWRDDALRALPAQAARIRELEDACRSVVPEEDT